jgi:Kef-type K+ transport system membrane component KefB/voltage-gated potassium channel Kch
MHPDIITQIAAAIVVATVFGLIARALKQPLILAYVAAGILVGPTQGFGWVDPHLIEPISELGLILLLFMIGLEIDLKKLKDSGKPLLAVGTGQFVICVVLGLLVMPWLGFHNGNGKYDALYLAVAAALSSTMIVVKLLYDKFELDTVPGRATLGILVFQDIWAILFLAIQHDLSKPSVFPIALSLGKGVGLVVMALAISRYVLPVLFQRIAKIPELMLVTALGWCFGVSMMASTMGLSREMGALIAGVSLSAFPYNLDVVAKIISLRDFFITLFFVSLGSQIPRPDGALLRDAAIVSAFLIATRFVSISPILHFFNLGNRVSIIPAINLAQISEFSLVICALGASLGHIDERVLSIVVLTLVMTSVLSTYAIQFNHQIFLALNPVLKKLGFRDLESEEPTEGRAEGKPIFFLGFSRYASSLLQELLIRDPGLAIKVGVVDFNPQVKAELDRREIYNVYGDISHADTLHHANVHSATVVISTIPDAILKGTTNERLLRQLRSVAPHAKTIVTAEVFSAAKGLYAQGASFVFIPRLMSVRELADIVLAALEGDLEHKRAIENEEIERRQQLEVLP